MYSWNWNVVLSHWKVFADGALVTLELTFLAVVAGTALGTALALVRRTRDPMVAFAVRTFVDAFRALPILVLLIWLYYVMPAVFSWEMSPFLAALIALSLNLSAFVAETVHAGIESVPRHQFESGTVLGLSPAAVMARIVLPQAVRNILPNLMGLYITQLKNSSLASVIGVNEVLHRSNVLISNTFRPLEIYSAVAATYLILIVPCAILARIVEGRLARGQTPSFV